ncbi:reverse transcriptase [Acanthamoeba castellanii str. Neff]|uniref:Reverse transcriptase n=1 Tax=Acanthamoeba castellanii (strain ATCC 30010 / Neff) TaxID=1257118 RepID=L8HCZ5_ACACF|nr:reverse transcriptase [Acanthamoeba castellanii str. Neff]ELR23424.1 reverse transcriptase [Acanthamoeba castellanii str. Neff]
MKKAHKGIPLLHGTSDYRRWHSKVIAHLESLGLKDHATGLTVVPEKLHQSETDLSLAIRRLEHEKHIQQTLGTIKKLVDDDLLPSIEGATTAKAALDILEAQLVAKNTARFIATICKLFSLKKKPEQSVAAYFAELDGLITLTVADAAEDIKHRVALPDPNALVVGQLSPFTITYSNDLLRRYITKHATAVALAGLPEEYEMARAIIGDWPEFDANRARAKISEREAEIARADSPSSHGGSDKLLYAKAQDTRGPHRGTAHHGQRQNGDTHRSRHPGGRPASATSSDSRSPKPSFQKRDRPLCDYCRRPGHLRAVCRRRLADTEQANVAHEVEAVEPADLADTVALVVAETELALVSADPHVTLWYLDSGATSHMAANRDWFRDYEQLSSHPVALGDDRTIHAAGRGIIEASVDVAGRRQRIQLHDVLHVPNLARNLLSTSRFASAGLTIKISAQGCKVFSRRDRQTVLRPVDLGRMLVASLRIDMAPGERALTVKAPPVDMELLHRRLGHISERRVRASTGAAEIVTRGDSVEQCEVCIRAKQTRAPIGAGPTQRAETVMELNLRLLLAFANARNLEIHQVDVDTAFLHAKLTEEIYISQPEGFVNKQRPHHVGRLLKSLYGLKQAPLEWNRAIDAHLRKSHFEPTDSDPCIYIRQGHHLAIVALYVDDCTIIAHKSELRGVKQIIADGFLIKDLGEATSILGIEIQRDRSLGKLYIRQRGKIDNILATFGLTNSKLVSTPMLPNLQLPVDTKQHDTFEYHSAIGMLLYLAHASRPDILFPVAYLSRFANNFGPEHVTAVKRIMRYLAGTANLAICYSCDLYDDRDVATHVPIGYCDADWGNIEVDR